MSVPPMNSQRWFHAVAQSPSWPGNRQKNHWKLSSFLGTMAFENQLTWNIQSVAEEDFPGENFSLATRGIAKTPSLLPRLWGTVRGQLPYLGPETDECYGQMPSQQHQTSEIFLPENKKPVCEILLKLLSNSCKTAPGPLGVLFNQEKKIDFGWYCCSPFVGNCAKIVSTWNQTN